MSGREICVSIACYPLERTDLKLCTVFADHAWRNGKRLARHEPGKDRGEAQQEPASMHQGRVSGCPCSESSSWAVKLGVNNDYGYMAS
ncbi:hypothetical protein HKW99_18540 [Stutzerimonas zhaodongensis]